MRASLFDSTRSEPSGITVLDEATASMSPIIRVGDRLAIARSEPARRGSVVAYFDGRRVLAHRLLQRRRGAMLLKGDGNRDPDPPVDGAGYCGVVIALSRRNGRTVDLTSRAWRLAGLMLVALQALPGRRVRWIVTRALCHAAARCLR